MTYEKYRWASNELITAAKLNAMGDGIEEAINKADEKVLDILQNEEQIKDLFKNFVMNYTFKIEASSNKLTISLL